MGAPTPLVAVAAYHLAAGRVVDWSRGGYAVPEGYVACLRRAGEEPVQQALFDEFARFVGGGH
ncbi:MAG TPA: hypothetical protein VM242_15060 [Acidimicrobiales bacterium]|nr:hypothetical protein [Acidimicrobiales bacterium]